MNRDATIQLSSVWKSFPHSGAHLLRSRIADRLRGKKPKRILALKDINLEVRKRESIGLIGSNGAGKSTLLRLVTGLMRPDRGRIWVGGRVAALLALGSAFHPDLTGSENLRLNAALLGLTRRQTDEVYESIIDFSELRDFIDEPLRTYSSGMAMRLAFAVAVHVHPDILVIDEVLAVGDKSFQKKCLERMDSIKRSGHTIFCATHDTNLIERLCDRVIWLDHGTLVTDGPVSEVLEQYRLGAHPEPTQRSDP